jgi:RNA recognition motif-containing protein
MENKIFVGNLAYTVTETQLQELFERQGAVKSARVICDKSTGRSRGYGFVEMGSEDEARRAIETLNGTQLEGRTLLVNSAHPQGRRGAGSAARQDNVPFARPIQNSERLVLHRHRRSK